MGNSLEQYKVQELIQEKDKQSITYMQNVKNNENELQYKAKTDSPIQETNLQLPNGKGSR